MRWLRISLHFGGSNYFHFPALVRKCFEFCVSTRNVSNSDDKWISKCLETLLCLLCVQITAYREKKVFIKYMSEHAKYRELAKSGE